jgi:hypothetical protein
MGRPKKTAALAGRIDAWRLRRWNAEQKLSFPDEPPSTIDEIEPYQDLLGRVRTIRDGLHRLLDSIEAAMETPLDPNSAAVMSIARDALRHIAPDETLFDTLDEVSRTGQAITTRGRLTKEERAEAEQLGRRSTAEAEVRRARRAKVLQVLEAERRLVAGCREIDPRDRQAIVFRALVETGLLRVDDPTWITTSFNVLDSDPLDLPAEAPAHAVGTNR